MSQRAAAVAATSQRHEDQPTETHEVRRGFKAWCVYCEKYVGVQVAENHLMPSSLRRVPDWFQLSPFQYNMRFMIAFLPGALLVATVTGKL